MAPEPKSAIDNLVSILAEGYTVRMRQVDGRFFIYADHPSRNNRSGIGHSLTEAIQMIHDNGKETTDASHGGK